MLKVALLFLDGFDANRGIPTWAGWLDLAALLDVSSRLVVGWAMDRCRNEQLVQRALDTALAYRRPARPIAPAWLSMGSVSE